MVLRECRGVLHTPFPPPHKNRENPAATPAEAAQFRACAMRPYGGAIRNYAATIMDGQESGGVHNCTAAV